ncbi:MAG: hypothetical protein SGILL_006372 [Bacillariaceae sp.]
MRNTARLTLGATETAPLSAGVRSVRSSRIRSRLFVEEDEGDDDDDELLPTALHRQTSSLKPLDLNLEFGNESDGDAGGGTHATGTAGHASHSTPSRNNKIQHHRNHHHHRKSHHPDTKTPLRPAGAMRKRQAEHHDLYGKQNLSFERSNDHFQNDGDIFPAMESPVDMYASPRISPSSPPSGGTTNTTGTLNSTTNTFGRMGMHHHKSPSHSVYRQSRGGGGNNAHKSPSSFRTIDGRTVQSKNPFSPMCYEEQLTPGSMRDRDGHVSSAAAKMELRSSPSSPTEGGNQSLFLNMSEDSLSIPASFSGRRDSSESSGSSSGGADRGGLLLPRHKLSKRDSTNHDEDIPVSMGMAGLAPIQSPQVQPKKDEKEGRHSFGMSPIKEDTNETASGDPQGPPDVCTNIHKIRRRTKGDDVVAAAAHGEPTWKREKMHIYTTKETADSPDDNISPTDVAGFPLFRPASSDTHTLPPTPSKPYRRPPAKRYTPIRKALRPPPTPMPPIRKARSFDHDDDDDEFEDIRGLRRHSSSSTMDYLSLSPGAEGGRMSIVAPAAAQAAPPSRFSSDFDIISELGNGSFGNVYKVLSRLDGCMYAIKVAHRPAKGIADKDRMLKEVYALAALSDQADTATFHIVRYHQAWMEENRLYIQTELCTTTLHAEMQQAAPAPLPLQRRYKCLREILLALEFIHKNGMVHLDIKPENIFLKNDQFKLGDFGLVSKISSHDVEEGDSRYMSTELLSGDHADLTKSDIFSLGITIYELCLGGSKSLPSNGPEWQLLRSGAVPALADTPDELRNIVSTMMQREYKNRLGATDLLKKQQLLSDEQKMLLREQAKVAEAKLALAAQTKQLQQLAPVPAPAVPKKTQLVRRNTWSSMSNF